MTRHVVNFRLGASRPEYKERNREFKEFDNAIENLKLVPPEYKKQDRELTRGPKSYLSAHPDQKNKKRI